jgi:hypothetical protein
MAMSSVLYGLSQILAVSGLAGGGLAMALVAGPATGPVAAVFPPWWDATRAVEAASEGGSVLRFGLTDFIVLVGPDEPLGRDRLRLAGAWLLLNPRGLAGCGSATGVKSYGI